MSPHRDTTYCDAEDLWDGFDSLLRTIAESYPSCDVAELGGGAKPLLAQDVWPPLGQRVVLDISPMELAKFGGSIASRVVDLCDTELDIRDEFDLVFSRTLCEHLPDPMTFHANCYRMLRPGGRAVHFFPTLYASPFVINRIIPERAAAGVLSILQRGKRGPEGLSAKFPAYYRWCKGPVDRQFNRFERIGFEVEEWRAGFGHSYYRRFPLLDDFEQKKTSLLIRHPVAWLTSFAVVVLRKPELVTGKQ